MSITNYQVARILPLLKRKETLSERSLYVLATYRSFIVLLMILNLSVSPLFATCYLFTRWNRASFSWYRMSLLPHEKKPLYVWVQVFLKAIMNMWQGWTSSRCQIATVLFFLFLRGVSCLVQYNCFCYLTNTLFSDFMPLCVEFLLFLPQFEFPSDDVSLG